MALTTLALIGKDSSMGPIYLRSFSSTTDSTTTTKINNTTTPNNEQDADEEDVHYEDLFANLLSIEEDDDEKNHPSFRTEWMIFSALDHLEKQMLSSNNKQKQQQQTSPPSSTASVSSSSKGTILSSGSGVSNASSSNGNNGMFMGLLSSPLGKNRIYGYQTTTKIKILVNVEDVYLPEEKQLQQQREIELSLLLSNVHELYIEYILNPFTDIPSSSSSSSSMMIQSPKFDNGIMRLVTNFNATARSST